MEQTLEKMQPIAPDAPLVAQTPDLVVYDVKRGCVLQGESSIQSDGVLVFYAKNDQCGVREVVDRMLQSTRRWVWGLGHIEPKLLRLLIDRHLAPYASNLNVSQLYRFFLERGRLYSLNPFGPVSVRVFRRGALLEFSLEPENFVELEPHDVVITVDSVVIDRYREAGTLREAISAHEPLLGLISIDEHLPQPNATTNRGKKCRRIEVIGRWMLFLFYAALTGLTLLTIFWIL